MRGDVGVCLLKSCLNSDGASDSVVSTLELRYDAVTLGSFYASMMPTNQPISNTSMICERLYRAIFIEPHEPSETLDIGREYRCKLALTPLRLHVSLAARKIRDSITLCWSRATVPSKDAGSVNGLSGFD